MENTLGSATIAMAGFAFATSVSPGPVNIVSAMSGAKFGWGRTIPYVFGATSGFVTILAITGCGLSPLITRFPVAEKLLAVLGSAYMLRLAYKLAKASLSGVDQYSESNPPSMMAGIIAQYANPKAWIVSISAVSIFVSTTPDYGATLLVFCTIFFVICFPSLWAWSLAGASLRKKAGSVKVFNLAMASLLVISIITVIVDTFRPG
jgi:threonine/homoserine/homoserine lactone efflux protein